MTSITVTAPVGRFSRSQRAQLAKSLTEAVQIIECGQIVEAAKIGFQVYFNELGHNAMAIGGVLIDEEAEDIMIIDVAVMDGEWPVQDRQAVIQNIYTALGLTLGEVQPRWWIQFRVIEEGSWGSRGAPLSMYDLLNTGAFTDEKALSIEKTLAGQRHES